MTGSSKKEKSWLHAGVSESQETKKTTHFQSCTELKCSIWESTSSLWGQGCNEPGISRTVKMLEQIVRGSMRPPHLPDTSYTSYREIPPKEPVYPISSKDLNNGIQPKQRCRAKLVNNSLSHTWFQANFATTDSPKGTTTRHLKTHGRYSLLRRLHKQKYRWDLSGSNVFVLRIHKDS